MTIKRKTIASGILEVREAASPEDVPRWLDELDMWADAHLREDRDRPGAAALREVKSYYKKFRNAIGKDPETAIWSAMRMLHAMWLAQTLDARIMIDGGVKRYRTAVAKNIDKSKAAGLKHNHWSDQARLIRQNPQHAHKSKVAIAKLIDKNRWNTIRKYI